MSAFTLTKGSASALAMLATQTGSDTLMLTEPARELRATIRIEPAGTLMGGPLRAELFLGEQRHSITVQRGDTANAQHLAEWVESIANGTLDTALAAPQRDHPGDATDMVDHPPLSTGHRSGVECIELAQHLPFCLGTAFAYLFHREESAELRENLHAALWHVRKQQQLTPDGLPHGHLNKRATQLLRGILAFERPPYRDAMELVATGRLLGCAEKMIQAAITALPS